MKFTVYAIRSIKKNYTYVGLTGNLEKRLFYHNNGYEKTTKSYSPFELIFAENFETRMEAREKEKFLKSGVGRKFLKSL